MSFPINLTTAGSSAIGAAAPTQQSASSVESLLPVPARIPSDPMAALYAFFSQDRRLTLKNDIKALNQGRKLKKAQWERIKQALKRAQQKQKKRGFFNKLKSKCLKVAKYAAIVAAVGLAVGTGGAGAVGALAIAAVVLSSAACVQTETQVLQKMGVSDEWAGKIETGLYIGGAACGLGAGGLALVGVGATASATGSAVAAAAAGVGGVSTAAAGYAHWQEADADSAAKEHAADAVEARAEEQRIQRMLTQIMSDLEASEETDRRTLDHLRGAMEARDAAITMSTMRV